MWGNEDTFWVANDGSGATDKLYAYNRSDGSRDSANDFDNLNGAGNNQLDGICSDGTTMFVADSNDNKLYAYKMSDTTADSTKDITLDSDNGEARGMWCDATTVYVANDGSASADNKVFAYTISSGAHDSTKDFEELYLSTNTAAQNAESPRGIWSNGTTMFVVDDGDDNVFAYKHADESQDSAKNLPLISANTAPEGMWFDGRILWVVDRNDDKLYAYDLPAGQPDNTPAVGGPVVRSEFSRDYFRADVTSAFRLGSADFLAGFAVSGIFSQAYGSISESEFTLDGETYTVRAVYDGNRIIGDGDLFLELDKALPRGFTFTADGTSYSSDDATESDTGHGPLQVPVVRQPVLERPRRIPGRSDRRNAQGRRGGGRRRLRHHGLHRRRRERQLPLRVGPGGRHGGDRHRRDRRHVHADRRRRGQAPQGAGRLRRRRGLPGIPPHQPAVRPGGRRRPAH